MAIDSSDIRHVTIEQCKLRWQSLILDPSDHEAIGDVAGAGRRRTSEPTTSAIGKVS